MADESGEYTSEQFNATGQSKAAPSSMPPETLVEAAEEREQKAELERIESGSD